MSGLGKLKTRQITASKTEKTIGFFSGRKSTRCYNKTAALFLFSSLLKILLL